MGKVTLKPVVGYEDIYSITPNGRIYSEPRVVERNNGTLYSVKGKWLKIRKPSKDGYMRFRSVINGQYADFTIHRMVAEAYIPNPKNLPQINHKDANKLNNHYKNLEWCDRAHNIAHGVKCNLFRYGENNPQAKLTERQVRQIRKLYKPGWSWARIADKYGVHPTVIGNIIRRRNWKRVY